MQNTVLAFLSGFVLLAGAQPSQGGQLLWGVSPFQNQYYQVNPADGSFNSIGLATQTGETITGLNAITIDPTTGVFYVVTKLSGQITRHLATFDPVIGMATEIGDLGDNFSSLTFDSSGQLYGVTGDGAATPETLYTIDKASAARALFQTLGNGTDGEVIAFNPVDGLIYHWSGNAGNPVFETIDPVTHIVTGIPLSGAQNVEIFGAVWNPLAGNFYTSNIQTELLTQTAGGAATLIGTGPGGLDYRGLALQITSDVPEPASLGLMVLGLGALAWRRARRAA